MASTANKSTPVKNNLVTWLISLVYSLDLQCFVMFYRSQLVNRILSVNSVVNIQMIGDLTNRLHWLKGFCVSASCVDNTSDARTTATVGRFAKLTAEN